MKVLFFGGGLGNQIFCYAFYLWCEENFPYEKVWLVCDSYKMKEHYGLEIDKWFEVTIPQNRKGRFIYYAAYFLKNIFHYDKLMDLDTRNFSNEKALVINAFKYTKKYIPSQNNWLRWRVNELTLSPKNTSILIQIRKSESCFIHVRRGDYLSPRYQKKYEGCCTEDYYRFAIQKIIEKVKNVKFFVFSDEIDWCREKLSLPQETTLYVDWNRCEDSPLDMFLMSNCKYGIIANSTFSYWGARLGRQKAFVVYPLKWMNDILQIPEIFPEDWIGL